VTTFYVRSTDGSDSDSGLTWALAKATLKGALDVAVAGDTVWVSQAHSEANVGSTLTITCAGVAGNTPNPCYILCGNDAAEPPTALATTAVVQLTGNFVFLNVNGSFYCYGITFRCGTGTNTTGLTCGTTANAQVYDQCKFEINTTNSNSNITFGGYFTELRNPTFKFSAAAQHLLFSNRVRVLGGSFDAGSVQMTSPLVYNSATPRVDFIGFDFSVMSSSFTPFDGINSLDCSLINCKMPASWAPSQLWANNAPDPNGRLRAYNCGGFRSWVEDPYGTIKDETTVVRSGGASDGASACSWKITRNSRSAQFYTELITDPIVVWNTSTGSSKTVTLEFVHDSVTNLKDDEIWIEVQYPGSGGLGTLVNDRKTDIMATGADQAASTETWTTTGLSNPNKQKLSVSFTPQAAGLFRAVVHMTKASYTVYLDPKLTVT